MFVVYLDQLIHLSNRNIYLTLIIAILFAEASDKNLLIQLHWNIYFSSSFHQIFIES